MSDNDFIDFLVTSFAELFGGLYKKNDINNMIGGQDPVYTIDQLARFDSLHDFHSIKTELARKGIKLVEQNITEGALYRLVFNNLVQYEKIKKDRIEQNYLSTTILFTETNGNINITHEERTHILEAEDNFIKNFFTKTQSCVLDSGNDKVIKKLFGLNFFITDSNIWDSAITRSETLDRFIDENYETDEIYTKTDNWTVCTKDGFPSAHFEHTITINKDGAKILTI